MEDTARRMNWHSATGVGHIHQLLWAPCDNSDIGKEKLAKALNTEGIDALLYVCIDLNRVPLQLPRREVKRVLIHQVITWVGRAYLFGSSHLMSLYLCSA